ncbi:PREDICTED: protein CROC-4 [Galeopterus variegatus]|uniref:Protein CROC-4 n=1 Tax=Galeopterus variegatus TaxID=482537 RepID=A0ABM0QLA9_GALVR|nr:PREDICTED: protein CROC-4 [Galeopterus variegatus]
MEVWGGSGPGIRTAPWQAQRLRSVALHGPEPAGRTSLESTDGHPGLDVSGLTGVGHEDTSRLGPPAIFTALGDFWSSLYKAVSLGLCGTWDSVHLSGHPALSSLTQLVGFRCSLRPLVGSLDRALSPARAPIRVPPPSRVGDVAGPLRGSRLLPHAEARTPLKAKALATGCALGLPEEGSGDIVSPYRRATGRLRRYRRQRRWQPGDCVEEAAAARRRVSFCFQMFLLFSLPFSFSPGKGGCPTTLPPSFLHVEDKDVQHHGQLRDAVESRGETKAERSRHSGLQEIGFVLSKFYDLAYYCLGKSFPMYNRDLYCCSTSSLTLSLTWLS